MAVKMRVKHKIICTFIYLFRKRNHSDRVITEIHRAVLTMLSVKFINDVIFTTDEKSHIVLQTVPRGNKNRVLKLRIKIQK